MFIQEKYRSSKAASQTYPAIVARQADNKCVAVISHERVQDGDQISKAEQAGRKAEAAMPIPTVRTTISGTTLEKNPMAPLSPFMAIRVIKAHINRLQAAKKK